jgi:hypothetical protein
VELAHNDPPIPYCDEAVNDAITVDVAKYLKQTTPILSVLQEEKEEFLFDLSFEKLEDD